MVLAQTVQRLSESDYLEIERKADFKSEFIDGQMIRMSGFNRWHSIITANASAELGSNLRGTQFFVFDSSMRVKVEATGLYTYPDVTVACEEQRFVDDETDTLLNPTVIVEVLSDSTEKYGRGEKFRHYQQIHSLQEYLLVSQRAPRVELFKREPHNTWRLHQAEGLNATITSPTLAVTLKLSEIYANVQFPAKRLRDATILR